MLLADGFFPVVSAFGSLPCASSVEFGGVVWPGRSLSSPCFFPFPSSEGLITLVSTLDDLPFR